MRLREDDTIDFSDLESYITPKTRMLGLCNPHNPLGKVYPMEDLDHILSLSEKYGFYIMNDEIWSDIVYSDAKFNSILHLGAERNARTHGFKDIVANLPASYFSMGSYGLAGDAVLPTLITTLGNPLIQGILLAGLIAAVMSCADSVLLVSSSNLVHDLWCGALKHEIKKENELKASRLGVLIIGVLGIVLALFAQNIISAMQLMATPFVGSIFPIVLVMFFWKKVTNRAL